ncbi:MAG: DUF3553 domain-containing protein [Nitrospirae bacterium]|nr:DUF3553 domain-containing protein [Nitrospirota bacterium]
MSDNQLLEHLNNDQRRAVEYMSGPMIVLACAGSGKTQLITRKYAYLCTRNGKDSSSVMAVTFTNKAANEMKDRIAYLVPNKLSDAWIGTFFSLCNKILREESRQLPFAGDFVIYDNEDQCRLIRHILNEMKLYEALYRGIVSKISCFKSSLITLEELMSSCNTFDFDEKLLKVYVRYQDEMKRSRALDLDDLVTYTINLLESNPGLLEKYQDIFSYVLIDEYQDTNYAQYHLIKLLSQAKKNILAVGDDNLNVYKLKGNDSDSVLTKFEKDFTDTEIINLSQNYRCTENILRVSHSVISKNASSTTNELWTERGVGEKVCHYWFMTEEEEAKYVAKNMKDLYLKGNYSYDDMAILYRVNLQSRILEEALKNERIPFKVIGSSCFYQKKEIKDVIAYLKLMINKDDNVSLRRIINLPPRGIGANTLNKLEIESRKEGASLYKAIMKMLNSKGLSQSVKDKLQLFILLIDELSSHGIGTVNDSLKTIGSYTGYIETLDECGLNNVSELMYSNGKMPLTDFLDSVALTTNTDEVTTRGYVSLTTLHNVKGLEFAIVFITGLEDGLLPYFKAVDTPEDLNEERRLFYLGMTRAKDILFMTGAKKRKLYSKFQEQEPSRFLKDIPKDCCMWIEKKAVPSNITSKLQIEKVSLELPYNTGCRVKHPKWGVGVIRDCYGEENDIKVTVNFPNVGIKRLALKYANLERI